jgi:hypothetical protein
MKTKDIFQKAETFGIDCFAKTLPQIIREIQRREGNFDCFGTAVGHCDQTECSFRSLCMDAARKPTAPVPPTRVYYSTKYRQARMPFLGKTGSRAA